MVVLAMLAQAACTERALSVPAAPRDLAASDLAGRDLAGIDASFDAATPPQVLGHIGYWYGKVNVHRNLGGAWAHDPDCTSGANLSPLTYCQKFYPGTQAAIEAPPSPKPDPVWYTAGCADLYPGNGQRDFACMD